MIKKKLIAIIGVFLILLVSPCYADWTQTEQTGVWETCTRSLWIASNGDGTAEWYIDNVTSFEGYSAMWNFTLFYNTPNWYDVQAEKQLTLAWNISGVSGGSIFISVVCAEVTNWGGLIRNAWLYSGMSQNNSAFTSDWWNWWATHYVRDRWNYNYDTIKVYVSKINETILRAEVFKDMSFVYGVTRETSNDYTVPSDFWNNVTVTMRIRHNGQGFLSGQFSDSFGLPTPPTSFGEPTEDNWFVNILNNIANAFSKVLPKWANDFLGMFMSWGTGLLHLLKPLINAFTVILPLTPLLFLFYLLDAGITSVSEGSFQPMGTAVTALWTLVTAIIHAIVEIGQTIWSFIKFW